MSHDTVQQAAALLFLVTFLVYHHARLRENLRGDMTETILTAQANLIGEVASMELILALERNRQLEQVLKRYRAEHDALPRAGSATFCECHMCIDAVDLLKGVRHA